MKTYPPITRQPRKLNRACAICHAETRTPLGEYCAVCGGVMDALVATGGVVAAKIEDIIHHHDRNVDDVRKRLCSISTNLRKALELGPDDMKGDPDPGYDLSSRYARLTGALHAAAESARDDLAFCVGHLSMEVR